MTGAETCELVLALEAIGDRERALRLLADMQHLRTDEGSYWTGYVWPATPTSRGATGPSSRPPTPPPP